MSGFRKNQFDILVATDIVARGIDVAWVSHVVNFDMPTTPDAYTHRIGRTGRSEREGKAYTFVTADDHALVSAVESRIGRRIARRKLEPLAYAAPSRQTAYPRRASRRSRGMSFTKPHNSSADVARPVM